MYCLNCTGTSFSRGELVDKDAELKSLKGIGGASVVVILALMFEGSGEYVGVGKDKGAGVCCDTIEYGEFTLGLS